MFRFFATAALIALSVGAAQAAEATVRFGDLNLASPAGARALEGRIVEAAAQSCGHVQLDFGVSARTITEAGQERKACIARVSERLEARIQAQVARVPSTRLARQ